MATQKKEEIWNPDSGLFVDKRKKMEFKTIRIGNQVWMAEDLVVKNVKEMTLGAAQKALPEGWAIPTAADFQELENFVGKTYQCSPSTALATSGVFPRNCLVGPTKVGCSGFNWTDGKHPFNAEEYWLRPLDEKTSTLNTVSLGGLSIYCISRYGSPRTTKACVRAIWYGDKPVNPKRTIKYDLKAREDFGSFTDPRDGNVYKTVKIGDQEWFGENLRYSCQGSKTYAGEPENSPAGLMYLWESLSAAIPEGWRIPTTEDMKKFWDYASDNYYIKNAHFSHGHYLCGDFDSPFAPTEGKDGMVALGLTAPYKGSCSGDEEIEDVYVDLWIPDLDNEGEIKLWNTPSFISKVKVRYKPVRLVRDETYTPKENADFRKRLEKSCQMLHDYEVCSPQEIAEKRYQHKLDGFKAIAAAPKQFGSFVDARDGETYRTVNINGTVWMVDNLRYKCEGSYVPKQSSPAKLNKDWGGKLQGTSSFAQLDEESRVKRLGRLYTFSACVGKESYDMEDDERDNIYRQIQDGRFQGIAPEGWHMPSSQDWDDLFEYFQSIGYERFECDGAFCADEGWFYNPSKLLLCCGEAREESKLEVVERLDVAGFNALPAGYRDETGTSVDMGTYAAFWNLAGDFDNTIIHFGISKHSEQDYDGEYAFSVRCVRNETLEERFQRRTRNLNLPFEKFVDSRDGEIYHSIKIGDQVWMAENLRYRTPNMIGVGDFCSYTWADAMGIDQQYNEEQVPSKVSQAIKRGNYRGIAPKGWHIPTVKERDQLLEYVKTNLSPSVPETLARSFKNHGSVETSLLSLYHGNPCGFTWLNDPLNSEVYAKIWTSKENDDEMVKKDHAYTMQSSSLWAEEHKTELLYVRCVKDTKTPVVDDYRKRVDWNELASSMPKPAHGTFTDDRDGEIYKTVKIGNQVWMAENLRFNIRGAKSVDDVSVGYFYTTAALKKIAPEGWRLPTSEDFKTLQQYVIDQGFVGCEAVALRKKNTQKTHSGEDIPAVDAFGFSAVPFHKEFSYDITHADCRYWIVEKDGQNKMFYMDGYGTEAKIMDARDKYYAVRLIKK